MPLKNGYSKATVSANIAQLRRENKSESQAVAIALKLGRESWRKKHPTGAYPAHLATRKTGTTRRKKAVTKKVERRRNPVYKEHVVIAQLRPGKAREATRKRLPVVNRLYFDGAGWTETLNNAARFRSHAHAVRIARLVVENKRLHNNTLRQVGVIEADQTREKRRGAG